MSRCSHSLLPGPGFGVSTDQPLAMASVPLLSMLSLEDVFSEYRQAARDSLTA